MNRKAMKSWRLGIMFIVIFLISIVIPIMVKGDQTEIPINRWDYYMWEAMPVNEKYMFVAGFIGGVYSVAAKFISLNEPTDIPKIAWVRSVIDDTTVEGIIAVVDGVYEHKENRGVPLLFVLLECEYFAKGRR